MNSMMPYRPIHTPNRVEYIKKKFESALLEEVASPINSDATVPFQQTVLRFLNHENSIKNLSENNIRLKNDINSKRIETEKSDGKSHVKRTPAFRREKVGSAPKMTRQKSVDTLSTLDGNLLSLSRNSDEEPKLESVKSERSNCGTINHVLQRSKTDTNLLKYCDNVLSTKVDGVKSVLVSKKVDLLERSKLESNKDEVKNDNFVNQYSVVNKNSKKNRKEDKDIIKKELKLSESLRRALRSPLPKGPPPKKPPRTFCHSTQNLTNSCHKTNVDIPKLKSKLEKLEKVIKIHESGRPTSCTTKEDFKDNLEKKLNKNLGFIENRPLPSVPSTKKQESQSCLPITSCLINQNSSDHAYEKLSKNKDEISVGNKSESDLIGEIINENSNDRKPKEPIYDLPCISKTNHLQTFGKTCQRCPVTSKLTNAEEGLHYMCADIVNSVHLIPRFPADLDRRKNTNCDGGTSKNEDKSGSTSKSTNKVQGKIERFDDRPEPRDLKQKESGKTEEENRAKDPLANNSRPAPESDSELSISSSIHRDSGPRSESKDSDGADEMSSEAIAETSGQMLSGIKTHSNKVSSKLFGRTPYWKSLNKSNYSHLFESCLLVGLTLCESKKNVPYIKSIFPPEAKPPALIESLCFPDASDWPPSSENHLPEEQYYSLVVTNENGERKFGYCRRVLPEGGYFCLPLTYCIISPHRANGFFYKVLQELESRHGSPGLEDFIKQLHASAFPGPGERLKLKQILENAARSSPPSSSSREHFPSSTLVSRPCDPRHEEKDLAQLLQHLKISVFLKVFSTLLLERKVLLLSSSLRKLSSCNEALQSILLPFSWQHTYISVLPIDLIEMCDAPTPYVIGLLKPKNVQVFLANLNFEEGIIVDLDDSKIIKCCGDEGSILPSKFVKDFKTSLNLAANSTDLSDGDRNVIISDAFIGFFVQNCGNYSNFIVDFPKGGRIFKKEAFIKSFTSSASQAFLEWFTETAMFNAFIEECLVGNSEDAQMKLFQRRATEYFEKPGKTRQSLQKITKLLTKK